MINFKLRNKRKALMILKHTYIELNKPIGLCTIVSDLYWNDDINFEQNKFLYFLINEQLKKQSIGIDDYDRKYAYMFKLSDSESRIKWIDEQLNALK